MAYSNLVLEKKSFGVRIVRISRPKALNALNEETLKELSDVFTRFEEDVNVRVVILTGDGEKAFVAGADIMEMKGKDRDGGQAFARLGQEVTKKIEFMSKPVIAAVNGYALGGGTEMAISCDFILASENAIFAQPEVGLGIIPGWGAHARLSRFIGAPRAKELIFSGRKVKADEAVRIGLVNQVLSQKDLLPHTIGLAERIAKNSIGAVSESKKLVNEFLESVGMEAKLEKEISSFGSFFGAKDQIEGMNAFAEKRTPSFEGI